MISKPAENTLSNNSSSRDSTHRCHSPNPTLSYEHISQTNIVPVYYYHIGAPAKHMAWGNTSHNRNTCACINSKTWNTRKWWGSTP